MMPVDEFGNRADFVMDPNATISRTNPGRMFEHYHNGSSRHVLNKIREQFRNRPLEIIGDDEIQWAVDMIVDFYSIVSSHLKEMFQTGKYGGTPRYLVENALKRECLEILLRPDNEHEIVEYTERLIEKYPAAFSHLTYVGNSGKRVTTKEKSIISSMYIMLLEKTGDDWSAVASAAYQHFGVVAPIPKQYKHYRPSRKQPIRHQGETEFRVYTAYAGPRVTAEVGDRNNNVLAHEEVCWSIITADKPTDIKMAVDRNKVKLGGKPLTLIKHLGQCAGWKFVYKNSPNSQ